MPAAPPSPDDVAAARREVPVLPAATVMFLRDGGDGDDDLRDGDRSARPGGLEVCLLRRSVRSVFVGGMSVFPGGGVDPADGDPLALVRCGGRDEREARARLGVAACGLDHWIAALREAFEECALLPAVHERDGTPLRLDDPAVAARFALHRRAVEEGRSTFGAMLEAEELQIDLRAVHYVAHWITPPGLPRRYDTRFFVARAPAHQPLAHDGREVVGAEWTTPAAALDRLQAGELTMLPPTRESLRWLAEFDAVDAVLAAAEALVDVPQR